MNPSRRFSKINEIFVQTVDFSNLTAEWIKLRKYDFSLKVLKVEKCPNVEKTVALFKTLKISDVPNLFVFVLESEEKLKPPVELSHFDINIFSNRPVILQLGSTEEKNKTVLIKGYTEFEFNYLSSMETSTCPYTRAMKEMLEVYGKFDGDILTAELSGIPEDSNTKKLAESALCLRVANLFFGGVNRAMPWLDLKWIVNLNHLPTLASFTHYPFDKIKIEQKAWKAGILSFLEILITRDSQFPINFNFNRIKSKISEKLKKILDLRRNLHQSIAEKDTEEVAAILSEIEKNGFPSKYVYNIKNESALATALQHFNRDVYFLLLNKKFKFCDKCKPLLSKCHKTVKTWIEFENGKLLAKLERKSDDHPIISRCWVFAGHTNHEFYLERIKEFFAELEKMPEASQLLKIALKHRDLKIIFDFKRPTVTFMTPSYSINAYGNCSETGLIRVGAKRRKREVLGTIVHELAHLAVNMLYKNDFKPYRVNDLVRKKEFDVITEKCRKIYESKEVLTVQTFNDAFRVYSEEKLASELIVRVPQVIASHSAKDIEAARNKYPELFAFYFNYFAKDIESFIETDTQAYVGNFLKVSSRNQIFFFYF